MKKRIQTLLEDLQENGLSDMNQATKLVLPVIIAVIGVFVFYNITDRESSAKLILLMMIYFIPPLGKESIIPLGVSGGKIAVPFIHQQAVIPTINPTVVALAIAFVDIVVALFLVWNYDLAKKIPLVGEFMIKVESVGRKSSKKYSWIKPLRFIGIMLFVMVPFQGSGGLVGSIIGRLIGMKPWNIFLGISAGSVTGCLLIAYFADAILTVFVQNFLLGFLIVIVILIIGIMIIAYRRAQRNKNKKK
jgi:uncharacterized membrane protein